MTPILYESNETSFVWNGICRLTDCLSCVVTEERNGVYECDFEYPISGAYYDQIQCGRIIACRHDDTSDIQPFDIVSYSRPINGVVSFHAVHISYRQTGMVARGTNINSLTSAFAMLKNASPSNPFTYETDITSTNFMASGDGVPRSVRQFLGGVEGSILDTWGGEYEFDKFTVRLLRNRGELKDFTIRYGLNLVSYDEDADYSGTYTSAIPYWVGNDGAGGQTVVVGSKVSSGLTPYNGREICAPVDLSDKFEEQPTAAQLEAFVLSQMQSNQTNLPSQNISVDFIRLQDSPEFAGIANLLECSLCDQVQVIFPRYNMQGTFKIVKTVFDVLKGRFQSMELGNLSTTLSEALGINQNGEVFNGTEGVLKVEEYPLSVPSTFSASSIYLCRYGKVAMLTIQNITKAPTRYTVFGALPQGWRPPTAVSVVGFSPGQSYTAPVRLVVDEHGNINLYNYRASAITDSSNISFTICWIIKY